MSALREMSEVISERHRADAGPSYAERIAAAWARCDARPITGDVDPRRVAFEDYRAWSARHGGGHGVQPLARDLAEQQRLLICRFGRIGQDLFATFGDLVRVTAKAVWVRGQKIADDVLGYRARGHALGHEGEQGPVIHPNLSVGWHRGDDAESPGRETDPAMEPRS